jgi:lysophospholipase L1-like esterase
MKKITFISLTLFTLFIIFELIVRFIFLYLEMDIKAFQKDPDRFVASAFTGYSNKPNWQLNHNTLKESFNSFGFKSPEFNVKKDNSTFRVVALGGSSVYGYPLENNQTWPHFLSNYLSSDTSSILNDYNNFEVINTGVGGYTTYQSVGLLFSKVLDLDPDLIILYQLWNDIKYFPLLNDSTLYSGKVYRYSDQIIDKFYSLTSINVLFKIFKNKTTNENFLSPEKTIDIENTYGLKQYRRNVNIIAMICEQYNIPLLLCNQITLYKENNSRRQIEKLNYGNRDYYLNAFHLGNETLRDISKLYDKTYYYDPSINIESNLDVIADHIHLTEHGNDMLSKHLSHFIINEILKD